MKSWMVDIAKEILVSRQDSHVTAYMIEIQRRMDQACKSDKSHTSCLSE